MLEAPMLLLYLWLFPQIKHRQHWLVAKLHILCISLYVIFQKKYAANHHIMHIFSLLISLQQCLNTLPMKQLGDVFHISFGKTFHMPIPIFIFPLIYFTSFTKVLSSILISGSMLSIARKKLIQDVIDYYLTITFAISKKVLLILSGL